jgi:hypothetical protein
VSAAKCDVPDCRNPVSVHLLHSLKRVCADCAHEISKAASEQIMAARFPRAATMLQATEVAQVLRRAADDLDEIAGSAPAYELGTLRRKVRAIVLGVVAVAESSTAEGP